MTTINASVHNTDHTSLDIEIVRFTRFITVEFKGTLLKGGEDFKFYAYVNPTADQDIDKVQEELFAKFPNAEFYDARDGEVAQ